MNNVSYGLSEQRVSEQRAPLAAIESLIGASPAMQEVFRLIERVGPTEANVLLTGESGSGKELAAQSIHERSAQASPGPSARMPGCSNAPKAGRCCSTK